MKRLFLFSILVLVGIFLSGCITPQSGNISGNIAATNTYYITIPIEPLPLDLTNVDYSAFTNTDYPNTEFTLTLNRFDASGNIQYGVGSANVIGGTYEEIIDFKKYFTSPILLDDNTNYAFVQIGMAYRAIVQFTLVNGSVNAGFSGITAGIAASNITGHISFSLYGLDSATAQSSVPMPSAISADKIEEYFQSLAIVKNFVNSIGFPIRPQIIAIDPNGHTLNDVVKAYYKRLQILQFNSRGGLSGVKFLQ